MTPLDQIKHDISFILTSDGRLGIAYTPSREEGGCDVLHWCPKDMLKAAAARLMLEESGAS